jgi:hypothetical protein
MSEKCKYTSSSAVKVKNQQKTVSIKEKLDVISRLEKMNELAYLNVRLAHRSIHTICGNADRIKESALSGTEVVV